MSFVLWHRIRIAEASGETGALAAVASFAGLGLPLTVTNDVYGGGLVLDAEVTATMAEGAAAGTFSITLSGLPAALVDQLHSAYPSGGLRATIGLGYFDEPATRTLSRPVMTGRVMSVSDQLGNGGVVQTVIEGQDEAGYLLRNKPAGLARKGTVPRLQLVSELLKGLDVTLARGSTIPGSVADFSVRAGSTLGALGQLAEAADVPIVVGDRSVLLGAAVGLEPAPMRIDPDVNLVSRLDAQAEDPQPSADGAKVRSGLELTVLGHPGLRAGQVVTLTGLDKVPAGPLRIGRVTHTYGSATGYVCSLSVTAIAPGKRARTTGGVQGVVDRLQDASNRGRADHPAIDVGQATAYQPGKDQKHLADLHYGQSPPPGVVAPSVASPVDDDVELHSKPISSPFAFDKVGLITPVYPGMRAVLAHNRGLVNDAVVAGWLWSERPRHAPPPNEPGDWWLALPTELGPNGLPVGKGANDLIDATGRRAVQVRALHVLVGGPALPSVGTRPAAPADDTVLIEHHSGTTIQVTSDGAVEITTKNKAIKLTNGQVTLALDGASVAVS
jgi:hypothetical protein